MLFELFKCPKCETLGYSPDFEESISSYMDKEFKRESMLLVNTNEPPIKPNYLIFKCLNCGYKECKEHTKIVQEISECWANIAWAKTQMDIKRASNFEEFFTRYLLDPTLKKFITQRDLDSNPLLKDFMRAIKDEEDKLTKKSSN